jgi:hypothetical protein
MLFSKVRKQMVPHFTLRLIAGSRGFQTPLGYVLLKNAVTLFHLDKT